MTRSNGSKGRRPAHSIPVGPSPVLLVARAEFDMALVEPLDTDSRIELVKTRELTHDWIGFADRVAAVLVATQQDPWDALVYATSASVNAPIYIVMPAERKSEKKELVAAGASGCVLLPIDKDDVDQLVVFLGHRSNASVVNPVLRLLLDPVGLVARYRDKSVHLTHREFAMLHLLNEQFGKPVSVQHLFDYVWAGRAPHAAGANTQQAVATWAYELRRKLRKIGLMKSLVNVRKFGYALQSLDGQPKRPRGRPRKEAGPSAEGSSRINAD